MSRTTGVQRSAGANESNETSCLLVSTEQPDARRGYDDLWAGAIAGHTASAPRGLFRVGAGSVRVQAVLATKALPLAFCFPHVNAMYDKATSVPELR